MIQRPTEGGIHHSSEQPLIYVHHIISHFTLAKVEQWVKPHSDFFFFFCKLMRFMNSQEKWHPGWNVERL